MNPVATKLKDLPTGIQSIIKDEELIPIIDNIGEDFEIPYTWRGELIRATVKILSGLMKPKDFIPFIMEEYSFDQETAIQLAYAINEEIFSKVKPELASVHNIEDNKLAHKIKVPHKPKIIIDEEIVRQPEISKIDISKIEESLPKPMVSEIMQNVIVKDTDEDPKNVESNQQGQENKKIETELSSKLDNLRFDKYREKF